MKKADVPVLFSIVVLLVLLPHPSHLLAQDYKESDERKNHQLQELNKTILSDKHKQSELLSFYAANASTPLQRDDTIALYLEDLDVLIDISRKQNIAYPIKLRDDCRDLIRKDLKELTMNGVQSGQHFKQIAATNDAYLQEIFEAYKNRYRPGWQYGKPVPEFGRADYLKAITTIFTTIVTLKVNSMTDDVNVVVYSMKEDKFVANSTGKTEFIKPLESGAYLVELSKPGYKKKVKKVVLGKYPRTFTIEEALSMQ